ncbi:MAG: integrase arm-type DNA-binding domain-containing protein [Beijerinckiaceae bacterium]
MGRQSNRLTARTVAALKAPGMYADGDGLYLAVAKSGSASWLYRYRSGGKRPELGLGSLKDVSLADARLKAAEARKMLAEGVDPLAARKAEAATAAVVTFGDFADEVIKSLQHGWRNAKHGAQWKTTLGRDYIGALRNKPVADVDTADVLAVLQPLWQTVPETAQRLRGRIEKVLDAAKAKGLRTGENPARWRGHLDHLLPKRRKLTRGHHAAMPFAEVPAFMTRLRAVEGAMSARVLEFAILTAARSGEARGARWEEIDLETKVWVIAAERMKAGREHRVALSTRAVSLLRGLREDADKDVDANRGLVFPGARGAQLSDMALGMLLRRMGVDCTAHGFRSSFRDWCGETTSFPREIAEAALAHSIGNEVEAAYRRGDALEKRRLLMQAWADYLEGAAGSNVVRLHG